MFISQTRSQSADQIAKQLDHRVRNPPRRWPYRIAGGFFHGIEEPSLLVRLFSITYVIDPGDTSPHHDRCRPVRTATQERSIESWPDYCLSTRTSLQQGFEPMYGIYPTINGHVVARARSIEHDPRRVEQAARAGCGRPGTRCHDSASGNGSRYRGAPMWIGPARNSTVSVSAE